MQDSVNGERDTTESNPPSIYRFGDFVLNRRTHELLLNDKRLQIQPKVFKALCYLLESKGYLVTRDELAQHLWPAQNIDYTANINTIIRQLRCALDDTPAQPRFIQTVPRKGYRFVAEIIEITEKPAVFQAPCHSNFTRFMAPSLTFSKIRIVASIFVFVAALVAFGSFAGNFESREQSTRPPLPSILDSQDVGTPSANSLTLFIEGYVAYAEDFAAWNKREIDSEINKLRAILNQDPEFAPARAILGYLYGIKAREDKSFEQLSENETRLAIDTDPNNPLVAAIAARFYLWIRQDKRSAKILLDALDQNRVEQYEFWEIKAFYHATEGDKKAAIAAINKALMHGREIPRIRLSAGWVHFFAGEVDAAERLCASVPLHNSPTGFSAANCLLNIQSYKVDEAEFTRIANVMLKLHGLTDCETNRFFEETAEDVFQKYWKYNIRWWLSHLGNESSFAHMQVASSYINIKQYNEAIDHIELAYKINNSPFLFIIPHDFRFREIQSMERFRSAITTMN